MSVINRTPASKTIRQMAAPEKYKKRLLFLFIALTAIHKNIKFSDSPEMP